MKTLVHYEIKKIWKRKSTGIVFLLMLLSIIAINYVFVSEQGCYGEDCTSLYGLDAISEKRNIEHALAGPLNPQRLQMTFQGYIENYVNQEYETSAAYLESYVKNVQPYREILDLIRGVCTPNTYDLSALDALSSERAGAFYETRQNNVQAILDSGSYTAAEKEKILEMDSQISVPFTFDYTKGWETLLTRVFSLLFMLIALATCIIISPVFSYEYQVGTDAILLPAKRGRGATVHAKILAGWIMTSIVYVVTVLIGVGIIAATFGVLGWNCDFQILSLNSFYDVQIWQGRFIRHWHQLYCHSFRHDLHHAAFLYLQNDLYYRNHQYTLHGCANVFPSQPRCDHQSSRCPSSRKSHDNLFCLFLL